VADQPLTEPANAFAFLICVRVHDEVGTGGNWSDDVFGGCVRSKRRGYWDRFCEYHCGAYASADNDKLVRCEPDLSAKLNSADYSNSHSERQPRFGSVRDVHSHSPGHEYDHEGDRHRFQRSSDVEL